MRIKKIFVLKKSYNHPWAWSVFMWVIKTAKITLFLRRRCYCRFVYILFWLCSSIPSACAELVEYFRPSINIFVNVYIGSCRAFFRNLQEVPFVTICIFISKSASTNSQCFAKPLKRE